MHLARRAYVLVILTAVLAIVGIWSSERGYAHLWQLPAALLLLGLAVESVLVRALVQSTPRRAFLGRPQAAAAASRARPRPAASSPHHPAGSPMAGVRVGGRRHADAVTLVPVRLGDPPADNCRARVLDPFALPGGRSRWPRLCGVVSDALRARARCAAWRAGRARACLPGPAPELPPAAWPPGDPLART
jgi:hypothetical protein